MRKDITELITCAAEVPEKLWETEKMMKSYDGRMFHTDKNKKRKRKRKNEKKKGRIAHEKNKK